VSAAYLTRIAGKSFIEYFRNNQDWGDGGITEVVRAAFQPPEMNLSKPLSRKRTVSASQYEMLNFLHQINQVVPSLGDTTANKNVIRHEANFARLLFKDKTSGRSG